MTSYPYVCPFGWHVLCIIWLCTYRIKCFCPLCAITDFMFIRPKNCLTLTSYLRAHIISLAFSLTRANHTVALWPVIFSYAIQYPKGVRCCSKCRMELVAILRIYNLYTWHDKKRAAISKMHLCINIFLYLITFTIIWYDLYVWRTVYGREDICAEHILLRCKHLMLSAFLKSFFMFFSHQTQAHTALEW